VAVYANDAKQRLLGVSADILKRHGAVSEQVVRAMVTGVTRRLDADAGIAVTGIAGPGGGTRSKPVGLVYVAALVRRRVAVEKHRFSGTRRMIKERSASAALDLLRRLLQGRL
jgi:PncC family amidohydrolase